MSVAIFLASTIYWMYHKALLGRIKIAYGLAMTCLMVAFAWNGFVAEVIHQQTFKLAATIRSTDLKNV